jgi:hypothetical protein
MTSTGDWSNPTNWQPNGMPSFNANVTIPSGVAVLDGIFAVYNLTNLGTLKGVGQILGNCSNGGTWASGLSPGTINIIGTYTAQNTAIHEMEIIGGYGAPGIADDAEKLESTGNISLNGT